MTDFRTVEEKAIEAGITGEQVVKTLRQLLLLLKQTLAKRPAPWEKEDVIAAKTEALKPALYVAREKINSLDVASLTVELGALAVEIGELLGPDYEPPEVDPEAV